MVEKTPDIQEVSTGTEAWSVADAFAKLNIFKPLYECNVCEIVAMYGTENMSEDIAPEMIPHKRIEALHRFKDNLRIVFSNTNFAIRKEDRPHFVSLRRHLEFVEGMLLVVATEEENYITHIRHLVINELHFVKCLRTLQKIKEEIITPLNNAGIIFRQSDQLDINDLIDDMVEGG